MKHAGLQCYTRTLAAIDLLMSNSEYMQKTYREQFTDISKRDWCREFCTVRVCGGRKTAHTTAGLHTALRFRKSLWMTTENELENAKKIVEGFHLDQLSGDDGPNILLHGVRADTENPSHLNASVMPQLDAIFVDMSSLLSPLAMSQVYDMYCDHVESVKLPFFFFFLQ